MKIALCLHGYFGTLSTNNSVSAYEGYNHINERLLKGNNVDVFFHNWQPEMKENIKNLYNVKNFISEQQINFLEICKRNNISQEYADLNFNRPQTIYLNATFERILSFYYSRVQAIKLALQDGSEYDWIVTSRFDISQRGGFQVNQLKFDKTLDNKYFYTTYWDQMNVGYGDMWFFSNYKNMETYSKIYEQALIDFQPRSEYENNITKGWFDSNYFNIYDFNDPRQFTNEILKNENEKSKNLMTFPRWRMPDSHLHHKWFAKTNNLYDITRWL